MSKILKNCETCNNRFHIYESDLYIKGRGRFCSRKCRTRGRFLNCKICNELFYVPQARFKSAYFCSVKCANEYQGRNKLIFHCKTCNKEFKWSKSRNLKNGYNVKFCSIGCRNKDEEWKLNSSINANMVQQNKKGPNKLEIAGRRILETLRKDFDLKFTIKEQKLLCKKFLVDIFIPSKNLIIQWDGDYWHGNTTKFKKLNKIQENRVKVDMSQNKYFIKCGFKLLRFWENEVYKNPGFVKQKILDILCN